MAKKTSKIRPSRTSPMQLLVERVEELERVGQRHRNTLNAFSNEIGGLHDDIKRIDKLRLEVGREVIDLTKRVDAAEDVDGPTWKTADGTVLRMKEMTDSHLANAICFLERQLAKKTGTDISSFRNDVQWRATYVPKLDEMRAEKARRQKLALEGAKYYVGEPSSFAASGYVSGVWQQMSKMNIGLCPRKFWMSYNDDVEAHSRDCGNEPSDTQNTAYWRNAARARLRTIEAQREEIARLKQALSMLSK